MWKVTARTRYVAVSDTQREMYPSVVYQMSSITCLYELPGGTGECVVEIECNSLARAAMATDREMSIVAEVELDTGTVA